MRERLGLKEKVEESVYSVVVSQNGRKIGKKTTSKSQLKETVSKLKSKYINSTISILNESGKVVKIVK
jgi:hypothetical protein